MTPINADCYGMENLENISPFIDKLREAMDLQNINIDGFSSEYGEGQFEVNLKYRKDPIRACDEVILLKYSLKSLAKRFGMRATFMAVPNINSPNGIHVNVSLQDEIGNNVLLEPKNNSKKSFNISKTALNCIGGLEKTVNDAMLIFAPNFNSYKRYYSQGFSPSNIANWGINNRTVAIRLPDFHKMNEVSKKSMRIEHRIAGADSNIYLVTAAILGGIYQGLKKGINPSPIEKQNSYDVPLWELSPPSMNLSLTNWNNPNNIYQKLFGKDFCDTFYQQRLMEWREYMLSISSVDFDWCLHY
jgi:glutamine synthetase